VHTVVTAFPIDTARGPLAAETARVHALAERGIAGAAVDVLEREPPVRDHPLRRKAADEVVRALRGGPPRVVVNSPRPASR